MDNVKDIKLITNPEGDWESLLVNGIMFYEGHSIPDYIWMQLFASFDGVTTEILELDFEEDYE